MEYSIVDIYYQRNKNNVLEYTKVLIKYALDKKNLSVKSYKNIIEEYMNDSLNVFIKSAYKVNKFLNENVVKDIKLKRIINYTINFIDDDKLKNDLDTNAYYIILLSKIILFSVEINQMSNIILHTSVKYNNVINNVLKSNLKIYDDEFKLIVKKAENEINQKLEKDLSDYRKFFNMIKDDKFYLNISKTNTSLYNIEINNNIKSLKKYLINDIDEQIKTKKDLNYNLTIITAELLSMLILKLLLAGKKDISFLITLPYEFIENVDYLDQFLEKTNLHIVENVVCLNIDYKSIIKNKEIVEALRNLGFKISIYDMNKLNHNSYIYKDTIDYITLNDELKTNSKDIEDFCKNNNLTLLDLTTNKEYIKENYLLKH